ncbi:lipase 3-like [Helicoverpa zea]|uniref:lipase 3-like n=1 Tax=Helicoverpa zea TaxID=7113 RepID=UPI001F565738|nr:lipase 3-like [Helicoverpa zea]
MTKKFVILFILINFRNGLMADQIISRSIAKITQSFAESFIKHPIITSATFAISNALAAGVNLITKVPYAVSRALGPIKLSSQISKTNVVDSVDKFMADFNSGKTNEDAEMSIVDILRKYGYSVERHEATTEDGFLLTMFRIPSNGSAVFLMHGLLGSADDFVVAGPGNALAYLLADQGYDVWMGNARGSKHSRRHISLQPSSAAFWDFSWHEIGIYDLPAMIDYVLAKRNTKTLKYAGFSQGTTSFFVMTSEKPEYNSKISVMVALSPVAFMANVVSPVIRLLAPGTSIIHGASQTFGVYEFLPDSKAINTVKWQLCGTGPLASILCSNVLFLIAGFDFGQLNVTNLPVIFGHMPAGASVKQLAHYGQGLISRDFRQFDYGSDENMKRYGVKVPPSYALDKIVAPVCLLYSDADWLAHTTDVELLSKKLNNVVDKYKIPYEQFNHFDFIYAKNVKTLAYKRLLEDFSEF